MTPSKRQSHQRHGEPKLFQCTGFGDCNMVFTRSEHLARHARKHTGEKPFRCVVPGCGRAFSRFDNMVQHTSTHSKHHDKKRAPGKKQNKTKLIKAVTPCLDGPDTSKTKASKRLEEHLPSSMSSLSPPAPSHIVLPDSPILSDMDYYQHHYQRLPSITESIYGQSPTTPTMDYFPSPCTSKHMRHHHPTFLPSPKELDLHVDSLLSTPSAISTDYNLSPPTVTGNSGGVSYWSLPPFSASSSSMCPSSSHSLSPSITSRKLSHVELALPIQDLSINHGIGNVGVDVTLDEFEALQGMSQLLSSETLAPFGKSKPFSSSSSSSSFSPWNSQVNSFRQQLALAQE